MKDVEKEYKTIKIKAAMNMHMCSNNDPTMHLVRQFEEKAVRTGRRSLIKDAESYAQQLGTETGDVLDREKISR